MASISLPTVLPAHPQFNPSPDPIPPHPQGHARMASRDACLPPLPAFKFSPGSTDSAQEDEQLRHATGSLRDLESAVEPARKRPPPLPAFSFNPGATMSPEKSTPSPTHPILEEMAQNRVRNTSRPAALPTFSFNSTTTELPKTPSPTKTSFTQDQPGSARSTGHRRRGSDFTGAGARVLPSTTPPCGSSPQKGALVPPASGHTPPRLTHQHRRSQAVSITESETSDLIKANAMSKHRAGSVPSTPTDLPCADHFPRSRPSLSSLSDSAPPLSPPRRASAGAGVGRPRVGFSDAVDVIPRPLSMISSETEDSTSTFRGSHSLTGSITSLGSPVARSPYSPNHNNSNAAPRPRTADAASPSTRTDVSREGLEEMSDVSPRPGSASSFSDSSGSLSSPVNKRRFWFAPGNEEPSPTTSPNQTPTVEIEDPNKGSSSSSYEGQEVDREKAPMKPQQRRAGVKKRKVGTLAGAIFSRKTRSRPVQSRGRRTPTPPLMRPVADEVTDAVFDEDKTIVVTSSSSSTQERQCGLTGDTNLQPAGVSSRPDYDSDDHVLSPSVDLDAATDYLGSLNMLPQTGFAAARGRMHSSMAVSVSDTFGVHCRAKSAPQMPPLNKSTLALHRLGSNGNLSGDVFDEEEEDDFLAEENKPKEESKEAAVQLGDGSGINVSSTSLPSDVKRHSRTSSQSPIRRVISASASDGIEIVDAEEAITREATRSSHSTLTGPMVSESGSKQTAQPPGTLAYTAPQALYASSGEGRSPPSSVIPSPDPDHITFENGSRFGVFSSTEDVPSLCDSESTGNGPRISSGAGTQSSADQRSAPLFAPLTGSTSMAQPSWKRASLASLNKLMPNAAHGDKSRLRFEASAEPEHEEKVRKRGNRISRLMSFWRSKEKENKR